MPRSIQQRIAEWPRLRMIARARMDSRFLPSGPYPNFVHDWDWRGTDRARDLLRQIYPTVYRRIAWPTTELTDDDAIKFATAF